MFLSIYFYKQLSFWLTYHVHCGYLAFTPYRETNYLKAPSLSPNNITWNTVFWLGIYQVFMQITQYLNRSKDMTINIKADTSELI